MNLTISCISFSPGRTTEKNDRKIAIKEIITVRGQRRAKSSNQESGKLGSSLFLPLNCCVLSGKSPTSLSLSSHSYVTGKQALPGRSLPSACPVPTHRNTHSNSQGDSHVLLQLYATRADSNGSQTSGALESRSDTLKLRSWGLRPRVSETPGFLFPISS